MKLHPVPEPERWSERVSGPAAEDVIGASFRLIRATTEPSDSAAFRWARRAMDTAPRAAHSRVWAVAIAGAILAAGGAVAARVAWRAAVTNVRAPARLDGPVRAKAERRYAAFGPAAPASLPEAPIPSPDPDREGGLEPPPAPPPPHPPSPRTAHRAAAASRERRAASPPAGPGTDDAPDEARLVARAFRQLRNEGDAAAALAALDERDRRFGAGTLATEAALARAEALLLLDRTDEALPILVGLRDSRAGLTPEVRAARAELLAKAKRCAEAGADFDALLAPGAPAATRERALYGRASCRLQDGQATNASADLETYLHDYPRGRFAPAVRDALARLRRP